MIQKSYALQVIKYFGLEGCQDKSILMVERLKFTQDMEEDTIDLIHHRSIVEKLIQLIHSSLDVFYSIRIVSRFMMRLQIPYLSPPKYILKYIISTLDY